MLASSIGIATGLLLASSPVPAQAAYDLVKDYSGQTFFDGWEFYGQSSPPRSTARVAKSFRRELRGRD